MLIDYCNQTLTRKIISSRDENNDITYTTSTIQARFEYNKRLFRNEKGEELMSNAIIYSTTEINDGDVITYDSEDWVVRFVDKWVDINGDVVGYKGVV